MSTKKRKEDNEISKLMPGIPTENILEILYFLDYSDLCRLRLVSKGFKRLASKPQLWQTLYTRTFGASKKFTDPYDDWFTIFADRVVLSRQPLYKSGYHINDGAKISGFITSDLSLKDEDYEDIPITQEHRNALYSIDDIILHLECSVDTQDIPMEGPVTVFQIIDEIQRFYQTTISDEQYEILRPIYESSWNHNMFPTFQAFKNCVYNYGGTQGDHIYYEGLHEKNGKVCVHLGS